MIGRKLTYMTIDTETCDLEGNVYDVGFTIHDRKGNIELEYNALVKEIFTDARKMMGAFYARKLFTHYAPMLQAGDIEMVPWIEIVSHMDQMAHCFDVDVICAYNLAFDRRVLGQTHKALGYTGKLFSRPMRQLDIWRFACETKLSQARYRELATSQGWVSDAGNLRTGAEYAYRFCSGDHGFIEDHTALSDARIETRILADCFATKKRVPYDDIRDKYAAQPWKIPNTDLVSGC